jgi:hypothetical protein
MGRQHERTDAIVRCWAVVREGYEMRWPVPTRLAPYVAVRARTVAVAMFGGHRSSRIIQDCISVQTITNTLVRFSPSKPAQVTTMPAVKKQASNTSEM